MHWFLFFVISITNTLFWNIEISNLIVKGEFLLAGKFIRTTNIKQVMPDMLTQTVKDILKNPYYLFNNLDETTVTYYNINTTMTTLDEATRGNYAELTAESPIRYNKINNFLLYGIDKIEPNFEINEFGLEGSDVQADGVVLPKTIIPYPGDIFTINHLGEKFLFKVTTVNPNTLDTGATLYKINYSLFASDGIKNIQPLVVKEYNFILSNYGSNFGCLILSATQTEIEELERYTIMLKNYYINLFYDSKIQSFSYRRKGCFKCHDPYLIEFMIRNKILDGSTEYIHLQQQIYLPSTFGVDYDRTFFSALEDKDPKKHYCKRAGNLIKCTQKLSLLYAYPEDYYCMEYFHLNTHFHTIDIFNDASFMDKIINKEQTNNVLKNIIINYFNDISIDKDMLEQLKHVDYMQNEELFYLIPFVIYCIEGYISSILSQTST